MYKSERIFNGEFGAYMNVELVWIWRNGHSQQNDGPCTLIVDTDDYEGSVNVIRERLEKEERSKDTMKNNDDYLSIFNQIRGRRTQE